MVLESKLRPDVGIHSPTRTDSQASYRSARWSSSRHSENYRILNPTGRVSRGHSKIGLINDGSLVD